MAIAHVNTGSDSESSFTSSFLFDYGFSPTEGNIMIVMIGSNNVGAVTAPDGSWTTEWNNGANGHQGWVGWKVAAAAEPSSATWTRGVSQKWVGGIVELSGQHATPIHKQALNSGNDGSPTSSGVTPTVDGCYIWAGFISDIDDGSAAAESGLGNKWTDTSTTSSGQCTAGGSELQVTAAATGDYVHSATSAEWKAYSLAIEPAAGGTSIPIFMNHYRQMRK